MALQSELTFINLHLYAKLHIYTFQLYQKISIFTVYAQDSLKVISATEQQLLKMCHVRHRLRIFLFRRKILFRSQDIQVFVSANFLKLKIHQI